MHTTHLSTQAIEFITVSLAYCTALEDDMSEHTTMYFDKLSIMTKTAKIWLFFNIQN